MKQIRPKRLLTAILVLVLAFCLLFIVACGGGSDSDSPESDAPGDTVIPGDITTPDDGDGNDQDGGDDLGGDLPGDVPGDVPGDTTDPDDGNESETTETESDFTFTLSATKDHYIVTGYVGEGGAATIPAEYNGLPVKQIDSLGSATAYKILTLDIPEPVETIGAEAFEFCYALIAVRLPSSLTSIGMRAFRNSYNLFEICNDSDISLTPGSSSNGGVAKYAENIYSSVSGESKLTSGGGYTFYDDAEGSFLAAYTGTDTEITLPATTPNGNAYDVATNVFCFSDGLTAIDMSAAEISELGGNTNGTLRSLTSVTLPATLKSVGQRFFANSAISEIDLPNGLEKIGNYAFSGSALSSVNLPSSLTDIGIEAFKGTAVTEIEIPSGITYLKNGLFENCTALESAALPEALKQIGDKVFKGAEKLTAVNMPSGVTDIGAEAFYGCEALTGFVDSDGVIRFYLPEGITAVSDGCFAYCPLKTSFTIPDRIVSIGDAAFKYTYLTELTISESLKSIGAEAFRYSKLRDLTIPDSLESLGENAFAAGEFTSATVPVKFIYNIRSWLDHAAILKSLTVTGTGTVGHDPNGGVAVSAPLDEYDNIETVVIENTVTGIGVAAFAGISNLKTVTIGNGVKTIGDNAFGLDGKGCYMLETVNIGSGVESIGECIFAGWHTKQHATGKLTVNYAGGKIDWGQKVLKHSNWHFDVKTNLVMNYNVK